MIKVPQRTEWRSKTSAFSTSEQLCVRAGVRAESTGLCGKPLPYSQAGQAAGLFASFCNFFFQTKKKFDVFLLQKEKKHAPSADEEKLLTFFGGKNLYFFPSRITGRKLSQSHDTEHKKDRTEVPSSFCFYLKNLTAPRNIPMS